MARSAPPHMEASVSNRCDYLSRQASDANFSGPTLSCTKTIKHALAVPVRLAVIEDLHPHNPSGGIAVVALAPRGAYFLHDGAAAALVVVHVVCVLGRYFSNRFNPGT